MIIRTSGNEGKIHIALKKKAIEMLNKCIRCKISLIKHRYILMMMSTI